MNVRGVGAYIRDQRTRARLSLSKLSGLAGVSIPYLSQIERGLRRPSADILQAIAKALRISSETLYVQAGMLEERPLPDVEMAIMADPTIGERHKHALLQIYEAFRLEAARAPAADGGAPGDEPAARTVPVTVNVPVDVAVRVPGAPRKARSNGTSTSKASTRRGATAAGRPRK